MAKDERAARILAIRESAQRLAKDARSKTRAAEKAEQRLVPFIRSAENTVLATDADELLSQVPSPVRFVVPSEDSLVPEAYLERVCAEREGFEILRLEGDRTLATSDPAAAIRAISPDDSDALVLAQHAKPVPPNVAENPVNRATGGIEAALLRTGLLNLVAAAVIVALNPVPEQVLTVGFALWVAVASLSAIVGAVTMKHKTAGTRFSFTTTALPTLLIGLTGLAVASTLFANPEAGKRFFGVIVAVYAMARGAADLWVATRVSGTAKPRWLLYATGLLGIVTALAIVFGPNHGRGILRLSLALYLGLTGASLLFYVLSVRRGAKRRALELLRG